MRIMVKILDDLLMVLCKIWNYIILFVFGVVVCWLNNIYLGIYRNKICGQKYVINVLQG